MCILRSFFNFLVLVWYRVFDIYICTIVLVSCKAFTFFVIAYSIMPRYASDVALLSCFGSY